MGHCPQRAGRGVGHPSVLKKLKLSLNAQERDGDLLGEQDFAPRSIQRETESLEDTRRSKGLESPRFWFHHQ